MFDIQISNPKASEFRNESASNLDEAIESIFPLHTEYAFIIWNHIFIPLSYKYDLSIIIKDIIFILNELSDKKEGGFKLDWPSDTFSSSWTVEFNASMVKISATWHTVIGSVEELLNANSPLEVEKQEFIEKWMTLFSFIKNKLENAGYNSTNLDDFNELEKLVLKMRNL